VKFVMLGSNSRFRERLFIYFFLILGDPTKANSAPAPTTRTAPATLAMLATLTTLTKLAATLHRRRSRDRRAAIVCCCSGVDVSYAQQPRLDDANDGEERVTSEKKATPKTTPLKKICSRGTIGDVDLVDNSEAQGQPRANIRAARPLLTSTTAT
jgi:hypothetical protein